MVTKLTDRGNFVPVISAARYIFAAWLLSDVLPNTLLGSFEPLEFNSCVTSIIYGGLLGKIIVVASLFAIWFLYADVVKESKSGRVVWGLVAVYLSFYMAWSFIGNAPQSARCLVMLTTLGLGLAAALVCNSVEILARVITALITVQAGITISYWHSNSHNFISGTVSRACGTYGNPMVLYPILLLGMPLAVTLALTARIKLWRCVWGFCSVLIMLAFVLTWYRWGMFAVTLGLMWLSIKLIKQKKLVGLTAASLAALVVLTVRIRTSGVANQISADGSWHGRRLLWSSGFKVFRQNWLTGIGATNFSVPALSGHPPHLHQITMLHPCSLLLLWMCEAGIGGGVLLMLFCWSISKVFPERPTPVAYGYFAGWLGILVASLMDTPFGYIDRSTVNIIVGAYFGAGLLIARDARKQEVQPLNSDANTNVSILISESTA